MTGPRNDAHQLRFVMRAFSRMSPDGRLPALRWLVERITSDELRRKADTVAAVRLSTDEPVSVAAVDPVAGEGQDGPRASEDTLFLKVGG